MENIGIKLLPHKKKLLQEIQNLRYGCHPTARALTQTVSDQCKHSFPTGLASSTPSVLRRSQALPVSHPAGAA
jgi:hypothetical protein